MHEDKFAEFIKKWDKSADVIGIPRGYYDRNIWIKKIENKQGGYPFAAIYNSGREMRHSASNKLNGCALCRIVREYFETPARRFFENRFEGYIVTPNEFPPSEGALMLISTKEVPMYDSSNTENLGEDGEILRTMLEFGKENSLNIYHQTVGAGATIGRHEHFHATTIYKFQEDIGDIGFDSSDLKQLRGIQGVYKIREFPFAHLVFDIDKTEEIMYFISNLSKIFEPNMANGTIPHTISQGKNGVMITPLKVDVGKSMGSELPPGFYYAKSKEEYEQINFEKLMRFMSEIFYDKGEVTLERMI